MFLVSNMCKHFPSCVSIDTQGKTSWRACEQGQYKPSLLHKKAVVSLHEVILCEYCKFTGIISSIAVERVPSYSGQYIELLKGIYT